MNKADINPCNKRKKSVDVWACRVEWICECARRHLLVVCECAGWNMYMRCWRIVKLRLCVFVRINSIVHFNTSASKTRRSLIFTVKQLLPLSFETCVSTLRDSFLFYWSRFLFCTVTLSSFSHSTLFEILYLSFCYIPFNVFMPELGLSLIV